MKSIKLWYVVNGRAAAAEWPVQVTGEKVVFRGLSGDTYG